MSENNFQWQNETNQLQSGEARPFSTSMYRPDRGGCLTAWLVFMVLVNVAFLILTFIGFLKIGTLGLGDLFLILSCVLALIGVVGVWQWKKWGYYLIMCLYGVEIIISIFMLLGGNNSAAYRGGSVVGAVLGALIFYLLMRDKLEYFD